MITQKPFYAQAANQQESQSIFTHRCYEGQNQYHSFTCTLKSLCLGSFCTSTI